MQETRREERSTATAVENNSRTNDEQGSIALVCGAHSQCLLITQHSNHVLALSSWPSIQLRCVEWRQCTPSSANRPSERSPLRSFLLFSSIVVSRSSDC
jgi:hypothetical protein